jgi:hypothetical protein
MLVALLALAMATTGTAFAAGLIGGDQIRDDAIGARHIRAGAVHGEEIRNLSVGALDLARASVNSSKIRNGSVRAEDLASDAVTASAISPASITSAALAANSVGPSAIANGAVTADALDPQLARIYQMGKRIAPGDPDALLTERGGFRYAVRCTDDGGGERTASLVISRIDGSSAWSLGGSATFIARMAGPITEWIGALGGPEWTFDADSTDNQGAVVELWVGGLDPAEGGQRLSLFVSNNASGTGECVVAGTLVPLSLQ